LRRVQTVLLVLLLATVWVKSEPGDVGQAARDEFLPLLPAADVSDDSPVLWVDGNDGACSDRFSREEASSVRTPWCSVTRAASAAIAGDTVHIRPGTYTGTVSPAVSGSPGSPIRFIAPHGDVTIDARGAGAALKIVSVDNVSFEGMTITGAAVQGVRVSNAKRVGLRHMVVRDNGGPGVQIRESQWVSVDGSVIQRNGGAGIFETTGSGDCRYTSNQIIANGRNGERYNGDGLQLAGARTYVAGNTIKDNGDPGEFEHGIYLAAAARDYVVESNIFKDNAGSDIKAAGADGVLRYNRLDGGRLGLVFSDNATPVAAYYNLVFGRYRHAVLLTSGRSPARAKLWNNTIVVTGRSSDQGDASAIFVNRAASLDLRNNVVSYTHDDGHGAALYVRDARDAGDFTSDNNWFSTAGRGDRHLVRNGSRLTLSEWRSHGHDAASIGSEPPTFDRDARIVSEHRSRRGGQNLGLSRDYGGTPVPSEPDGGAHQSPA
jgi:Right handed beta helix region